MYLVAHGILVPLAGIEPGPLAVSAWSPKLLDHMGFFGSSEENKLFGFCSTVAHLPGSHRRLC